MIMIQFSHLFLCVNVFNKRYLYDLCQHYNKNVEKAILPIKCADIYFVQFAQRNEDNICE